MLTKKHIMFLRSTIVFTKLLILVFSNTENNNSYFSQKPNITSSHKYFKKGLPGVRNRSGYYKKNLLEGILIR